MTPFKIMKLFRIHMEFNPDRFKPDSPIYDDELVDIDEALQGL